MTGRRLARRFARLRRAVAARAATPRRAREAEAAVRAAIARAAARAAVRRAAMDPARPDTLHRLRVALKRHRYMAEALARLCPQADEGRLAVLREAQRRLGHIQDLDVLLRRVEAFARGAADPAQFEALAGRLRRRRDHLVREFAAAAGPAEASPRRARPGTRERG